MEKFKVSQEADYITGHLRYGHREGVIEANSKEDALDKLKNKGYTDYLDLKVDDYEVEDDEVKIVGKGNIDFVGRQTGF